MGSILHNKTNQALNSWASNFQMAWLAGTTSFTLIFAVLAGMMPHLFGVLNWPEKIFVGLLITLSVLFLLSALSLIAGVAFRRWFPAKATERECPLAPQMTPDASSLDEVRGREIAEEVFASRWVERGEIFADAVSRKFEQQLIQIATLAGDLSGVRGELEKTRTSVDYAISAMGDREWLLRWAPEIEDAAKGLGLKACGGSLTENADWTDWEKRQAHWRGLLDQWMLFAAPYRKGLREEVLMTPESTYDGNWTLTDAQFPGSSAVRKYKTFCIIHSNWEKIKEATHDAVRRAAFEGAAPVNATPAA